MKPNSKIKKLMYSWRVSAILNYIKHMLSRDDCDREDVKTVVDNYIRFVEEMSDASIVVCKSSEGEY